MIIISLFIILAVLIYFSVMKKIKLLIIFTIILGLIMMMLIVLHSHIISKTFNKGKSLEEITNVKFEDISYISTVPYDNDLTSEFKENFKNIKLKEHKDIEDVIFEKIYKKYDVSYSVAYIKYKCYDKNNNLLYTIDTGYCIEINGVSKKYYN